MYDIIIVGSGPAGMTASLYASRAGLKVAVIEYSLPGGKLLKTFDLQNYPGYKKIVGSELAMQMYEQSLAFGAESIYGKVVKIENVQDEQRVPHFSSYKKVHLEDGSIYEAKAVILATGTVERLLQIEGEEKNLGRGVSFCAVCDGSFFKDEIITVIGGGNSALEEALYLAELGKKVNIVIRRDVFRAEPIIQQEVEKHPKIQILRKTIPLEILDDGTQVSGIRLKKVDTGEEWIEETKAVFPYIGADPLSEMVKELGVLDEAGYVLADENMQTKVEGLYVCGDVRQKKLRQVVTATADGAIAAQHIFHKIKGI